jgi:magnesium transporter
MKEFHFNDLQKGISDLLEELEDVTSNSNLRNEIKLNFLHLHATEQAEIITELKPKQRAKFISIVSNDIDAEILTHLDRAILLDFFETVGKQTFGKMLSVIKPLDSVYILEDFSKEVKNEILDFVQYKKRIKIEQMLSYPKDSVGRNMNTEFLNINEKATAEEVIEYVKKNSKNSDNSLKNSYIFITNNEGRLLGDVSIFEIIKLKKTELAITCINKLKHFVNIYDEISEVSEMFIEYNLQIIPVIDVNSKMIGILDLNEIASIIKEEAEKNFFMHTGVFNAKKEGVFGLAKARFSWLFVNFLTASTASSIITVFEPLVASFAVLATLTPIVASIGGNTGNQSSAVVIRSLAINDFELKDVLTEVLTALLNSVFFCLIAFILSYAFYHNFWLSLSFSLAIFVNINVGGIIGSLMPALLHKLNIDPALCSSIFVTMMTDMLGFFSFLGIAYLILV